MCVLMCVTQNAYLLKRDKKLIGGQSFFFETIPNSYSFLLKISSKSIVLIVKWLIQNENVKCDDNKNISNILEFILIKTTK